MMKKRIFLIISIIFIIAVLMTAIIYYYGYYAKPEQTFKRLIATINDDMILKNTNFNTYRCDSNLDINLQSNIDKINSDVLNLINNSDIDIETLINKKDKQVVINFSSDYDNSDLLNFKICNNINNKESYIFLKDFFNKYLKIDINERFYIFLEDIITINEEDIKNNIEIVKENFTKLIPEDSCVSVKEEISIGDNVKKVNKDTLRIKVDELINILNIIYQDIENNEIINKYKEAEMNIDVYTTGILKDKIEKVDITIVNTNENIKITIIDDVYYYEILNEGKTFKGNFKFQRQNENKGNLNLILETEELGNMELQLNYVLEYDADIELVDISNNTDIDGLTKDEQVILSENFKKSNLYSLIKNIVYK